MRICVYIENMTLSPVYPFGADNCSEIHPKCTRNPRSQHERTRSYSPIIPGGDSDDDSFYDEYMDDDSSDDAASPAPV